MARLVLVHGAWHGGWAWDTLAPLLRDAGHEVTTVDLPSAGGAGDLAADAAVVAAAVAESQEPTVVVAHSYGGLPTTQATAGLSQVSHLVYVCAFMLDEGESLVGALGGQLPDWIWVDQDAGVSRVLDPMRAFYADVDPTVADTCVARLSTQTLSSFADPLTAAGWHDIPSTYVACTQDQAIPYPAQQAMSGHATTVHTLESSHSPFLSHPEELAEILGVLT